MSSQSRYGLLAVCGSLLSFSSIALALRLYARKKQRVPYMMDDVLAVAGLISYTAASVVIFIAIHYKTVGYQESFFTPIEVAKKQELSTKLSIAWDVTSTASLACVKLSVLFFYRRIFCIRGLREWFRNVSTVTIAIVVLWLVVFQFLTGFQCGTHFSALWDGTYLQYCVLSFPFLYGLAVSDVILDVWILALPIPRIIQLHATRSKKLSIVGIFLLAFVGLGASIARMVEYIAIENGGPLYFIHHDQEEAVTQAYFFTMLETGISLVAVNLPSLWLLFSSITPQSIIRGLRSMLSIHSLRSGRSHTNSRDGGVAIDSPSESLKSRDPNAAVRDGDYLSHDLEAQTNETTTTEIEEVIGRDSLDMGIYISRVESGDVD